MKVPTKIIVVLPCHALNDFPTHYTDHHAQSLLANWTAPWHPSLIAATGAMPSWISADVVEADLDNHWLLVPTVCLDRLGPAIRSAAESRRAVLIQGLTTREEILGTTPIAELFSSPINANLTADFHALGYALLQVQLMTRQLRYSSTLNLELFERHVESAAQACVRCDDSQAQAGLTACFDLLLEERSKYYPATASIIHLFLTLPNLVNRLSGLADLPHKYNLLLSGSTLKHLDDSCPGQLDQIKRSAETRNIGLASGGFHELPVPLVSTNAVANQIQLGTQIFSNLLGTPPDCFASYRFGLHDQLPSILEQCGQSLAIHAVFDGGQLPRPSSSTIHWQGHDGTHIMALASSPMNADSPDDFLRLGPLIGEQLDGFHHAELLFVQWPAQPSEWMDALIRIHKYGPLLGRFQTLEEFSRTFRDPGFSDSFSSDEYVFPYLETAVEDQVPNPISVWSDYWRIHFRLRSLSIVNTMLGIVMGAKFDFGERAARIGELQRELETQIVSPKPALQELDEEISDFVQADFLVTELNSSPQVSSVARGSFVINASGVSRPAHLPPIAEGKPTGQSLRLQAFQISLINDSTNIVADDDPPVLFTSKTTGHPALRNEHFELLIDPQTGGVRSVKKYDRSGNLCSQQLACRLTETVDQYNIPRLRSRYTQMRCDSISCNQPDHRWASITTTGRLDDVAGSQDSSPVCRVEFRQTVSVARGSRMIEFDVELKLLQPLCGQPWRNYVASRIAWPDESALVLRSQPESAGQVFTERLLAPNYVAICWDKSKICLLPGGIPFHRRSSRRTLDTLLSVQGESQTRFQFALAVNPTNAYQAAMEFQSPCYFSHSALDDQLSPGWLFHLNCSHVHVVCLEPVSDETGRMTGVLMRLQETDGRAGELCIRAPRDLRFARRCDFLGRAKNDLPFEHDCASCTFLEFQFFQIELRW